MKLKTYKVQIPITGVVIKSVVGPENISKEELIEMAAAFLNKSSYGDLEYFLDTVSFLSEKAFIENQDLSNSVRCRCIDVNGNYLTGPLVKLEAFDSDPIIVPKTGFYMKDLKVLKVKPWLDPIYDLELVCEEIDD